MFDSDNDCIARRPAAEFNRTERGGRRAAGGTDGRTPSSAPASDRRVRNDSSQDEASANGAKRRRLERT